MPVIIGPWLAIQSLGLVIVCQEAILVSRLARSGQGPVPSEGQQASSHIPAVWALSNARSNCQPTEQLAPPPKNKSASDRSGVGFGLFRDSSTADSIVATVAKATQDPQ